MQEIYIFGVYVVFALFMYKFLVDAIAISSWASKRDGDASGVFSLLIAILMGVIYSIGAALFWPIAIFFLPKMYFSSNQKDR